MSARPSLASTLQRILLPKLLAAIFAFSLLICTAVVYFAHQQVSSSQQQYIDNLRTDINFSVRDTLLLLESIAGNDLVVNSFIDLEQRDNYLPLFFRTLRLSRATDVSLALFDFSGQPIISKNWQNTVPPEINTLWHAPTLQQGQQFWQMYEYGMVMAVPVHISASIEGALVFYVKDIGQLLNKRENSATQIIVGPGNKVLYSTQPDEVAPLSVFLPDQYPYSTVHSSQWQNLTLYSLSPIPQAYGAVLWLIAVLLLSIIATLAVSLHSVNRAARLTANTLDALYKSILVRMQQTTVIHSGSPKDEPAELAQIRSAFDNLAANLMTITLSNKQFANVIDSLEELLVVLDNHNTMVTCNQRYARVAEQFNLGATELQRISGYLAQTSKTLDATYTDVAVPRKITIKWALLPFVNDKKEVIGTILVGNDVSHQRDLESRNRLMTHAMESATVSIAIADITRTQMPIVYVNEYFSKLSGFEASEALGEPATILVGPKTERPTLKRMFEKVKVGQPFEETLLLYKKNGQTFYGRLAMTPVRVDTVVTHYVVFFQDVTEQEKTREYLEEAKAKAEESARLKSSFLASMSHEVRTPLHGISGTLQLLDASKLDQKQRKYLSLALQSMHNLQHIVNDILDFSKIEAGQLNIEHVPFNLSLLMETIFEQYYINCNNKGIELNVQLNLKETNYVTGDAVRLRQIMGNLLSNAVKFTSEGAVSVLVELVDQRHQWQLRGVVRDSGIGIAKDKINNIFEVFTQEDNTTTRRFGGTGLGLAITRQLCQLCGGDITVNSEKGQGSTFNFTIQLAKAYQELTDNNHADDLKPAEKLPAAKILLVEDNEINQLIARENLNGHKVMTASNGKEAINALNQMKLQFDMILMDCHMPEMDGFEATRRIRHGDAGERYTNVPIVALTANAMKGDREACVAAGMSDYISKPFTATDLQRVIRMWATNMDKL
ncbi:hybrid sensor histidine kinase/response regulator [Alteromonas lipotrueiana]|uniref:hybrid sensor histidine kinase/response regulator n=1 Tax=Alteromonas lipotrueiana TaxID=2803815 RepID=UPI001C47C4FB|nr:ATP-binding protein [Alteromonas lipotrueiana]